jgi:hypothetical protein
METVTLVRNELGPLLDRLITQLEHEGKLTHQAHFSRIRSRLNCANDDWELGVTDHRFIHCKCDGFSIF